MAALIPDDVSTVALVRRWRRYHGAMPLDRDNEPPSLNPDRVYRNYLETCRRLGHADTAGSGHGANQGLDRIARRCGPFRPGEEALGRWLRYRALRLPLPRPAHKEVDPRYAEWEIIGSAEVRDVDPEARAFSPHPSFKQMMAADLRRYSERPPELQPTIDAVEAFLLAVFLRRYVTYCARPRRYAAMNGAARLFAELRA